MNDQMLSVLRPRPVDNPQLCMYLLHHAGGSHTIFRSWIPLFPPAWEIRLVVAPGRGKAAAHPAVRDLDLVNAALADHLAARHDDVPYALFGHSMGALAAFGAALRVQESGHRPPEWVGVSGHPGPFHSLTRSGPRLYQLAPDDLRGVLLAMGGLPERILRDDWIWERIQAVVRADLEAAESWRPRTPAVLDRPMSAFCGADDPVASTADTVNWAPHSTNFLGTRTFPGGHFYFAGEHTRLVAQLVTDVHIALGNESAEDPIPQM
ncbi:thioesterase II family protein [Nocardia mexicana]|uniref:Thioesterase TesA n=1 Tax=Nocardia mexicana TaxID=279262 RepID=A0A370GPK8_9NOCA|nr:thioesterase domain-containing protein [Nocardia mexicana]RDI45240.1 surfactin synthase thioesterase subunit [Nocardia mexicana]